MSKPILLDTYCRAGGASKGYHDAGFEVVGVDIAPQKHYPYKFICADALEYLREHGEEYDAIAASPPCQAFCALKSLHKGTGYEERHPDLIEPTRELLVATGAPWIMENVVGAPLIDPVMLCGTMFGLGTSCGAELRRHRLFESNIVLYTPSKCKHSGRRTIGVYGHGQCFEDKRRTISVTSSTPQQNVVRNLIRKTYPVTEARRAMGIDWMVQADLSQAIPPAYTLFLGKQLLRYVLSERR